MTLLPFPLRSAEKSDLPIAGIDGSDRGTSLPPVGRGIRFEGEAVLFEIVRCLHTELL